MKLFLCAALAVLLSCGAAASPSPQDIEYAFDQHDLRAAERMLNEVLRDHPKSARAHYELGQVLAMEGKHAVAVDELENARRLDQSLGFAKSISTFEKKLGDERTLAEHVGFGVPVTSGAFTVATREQHHVHWFTVFSIVFGGTAFLFGVFYLFGARRRQQQASTVYFDDAAQTPRYTVSPPPSPRQPGGAFAYPMHGASAPAYRSQAPAAGSRW